MLFKIRNDQTSTLTDFLEALVFNDEAPENCPDDHQLAGLWVDKIQRGGKRKQLGSGWDPDELGAHDGPRALLATILENAIEVAGVYQLRVEWRPPGASVKPWSRSKRFEVKRDTVPKADRTDDRGAAVRDTAQALANNATRTMDANTSLVSQIARSETRLVDVMRSMYAERSEALDLEQANVIDLMDQLAIARMEAVEARMELRIAEASGGSELLVTAINGFTSMATPAIQLLAARHLGGPVDSAPESHQERSSDQALRERIQELEAELDAIRAPASDQGNHEAETHADPV